jgi:phosphoribosyl 1,2-cyclic phosphate phosphodiesterase
MKPEEQISLTFLGTGTSTGVPVVACDCLVCASDDPRDKRLRTSALITKCGRNYIIDCGPDFRMQMIQSGIADIEAILLTHEHRDHIAGLDDLRGFNYVLNKPVEIYCTRKVYEAIQTEFPYIFTSTRFFGAPQINFHLIDNRSFNIHGDIFTPVAMKHGTNDVTGFRLDDLCYLTDGSQIERDELNKIRGSRLLVINALRNSRHQSHFSLSEALEIIAEINPEKAFITHVSHFLGTHHDVSAKLPGNVELAYDGLKVHMTL